MTLTTTLRDLIGAADIHGRAGPKRLAGGAHLEVLSRRESRGATEVRRRQLRVSRVGVAPSPAEIAVFRRDGRVPADAVEASYHNQRTNTYTVTITWETRLLALPEVRLPDSL